MKNKKILFIVALIVMILTALVTSLVILNKGNSPDSPNIPTVEPTIAETIMPTNSVIPSVSITQVPTTISPSEPEDLDFSVISYTNFAEYVSYDGATNGYLLTPSECQNKNCTEMYMISENDVLREDQKSILSVTKNAFPVGECSEQPLFRPSYAIWSEEKVFNHAEPGGQNGEQITFYDLRNFDIYINAEYQGKDDVGGNFKSYIFKVYSQCSTAVVFTLAENSDGAQMYPELEYLEFGDVVAISGVTGKEGAALGTKYIEIESDFRMEIFQ